MRAKMPEREGDDQRVAESVKMIADYVDKILG
jgi:hypothetical protein